MFGELVFKLGFLEKWGNKGDDELNLMQLFS